MTTVTNAVPHYTPRKWAIPAHKSRAKRKVLWVHRRGGKGWFSLVEGIFAYAAALNTPTPDELVPGFHAWTVAPTIPQARQSENELSAFLPSWARPNQDEIDAGHNKGDHTFTLAGSQYRRTGLWEIKSAHDPETLQTVGLDFLHVQECQDITETAFVKLIPTLRSPGRLGVSVWEGIPPDDPNHWFARMWYEANESKTGEMLAVKLPYTKNEDLTDDIKKEIEEDGTLMLEREFGRMYLAELPSGYGSFMGDVDGCIGNYPMLGSPDEGHRYVMGVDVAKKVDFTVIIVMDACHRKVVWERRIGGMDWVVQEEAIATASRDFSVSRIRMDSTGVGDPLFDRLRFKGLPVTDFLFTNESKYRILTDLAVAIEKRTISYPPVPIMLRELKSLRADRLPSGRSRVSAPSGGHDDYPMSLAMAYSLCDTPERGVEAYQNVKPKRFYPAVDTTKPFGLKLPKNRHDRESWVEIRKREKTEQRRRELEAAGVEF